MASEYGKDRKRERAVESSRVLLLAPFVFFFVLALHVRTLAPSITWQNGGADSGDLVTAAFVGGVAHPPGYPAYMLLARLFIALPMGGVAFRMNLLSALAASLTVAILCLVMRALLEDRQIAGSAIACSSALVFAFSPLFWSQAVIAEVYAVNALLTVVALGTWLAWAGHLGNVSPRLNPVWPWAAAVSYGVGLAHHPTIFLLLPGGIVLLWGRVPWRSLIHGLALAVGIALLLDLTLLLPARGDPPFSWGDPKTLSDVWWVVSGQVYRGNLLSLPTWAYAGRLSAWAKLLLDQFGPVGAGLGLLGAVGLLRKDRRTGIAFVFTFVFYSLFAISYATADSDVYLIPAFLVFALWMAKALGALVAEAKSHLRPNTPRVWSLGALGVGLLLLPLQNLIGSFPKVDQSRDVEAWEYGHAVFANIPENALVVAEGDRQTLALWYFRYVERPQSEVMVIAPGLLPYPWYREQLRRHNPDWIWPPPSDQQWDQFLVTLVENNVDRHAVFWTQSDPVFEQHFQFRPAGQLFQVSAVR